MNQITVDFFTKKVYAFIYAPWAQATLLHWGKQDVHPESGSVDRVNEIVNFMEWRPLI